MHSDNARPHTAKYHKNVKGLHQSQSNETGTSSPYSSDLAPSDFFLFHFSLFLFPFWLRQRKADGYRAETLSELLVRIHIRIGVILAEISREILNAVFLE
jgi:hypothetical protein